MSHIAAEFAIHRGPPEEGEIQITAWSGIHGGKDECRYYIFRFGPSHELAFHDEATLLRFLREAKRVLTKAGVTVTELW